MDGSTPVVARDFPNYAYDCNEKVADGVNGFWLSYQKVCPDWNIH
jgi:hypothetical protein